MATTLQLAATTAGTILADAVGYQIANKVFGANINTKAYTTYVAVSTLASIAAQTIASQTFTQLKMMQSASDGLKTSTALAACITLLTISITAPFLAKWTAQKASGQPLYWKQIIGTNILASAVAFLGVLAIGELEMLPRHQNLRGAN